LFAIETFGKIMFKVPKVSLAGEQLIAGAVASRYFLGH
jgi:hypothetical protein